MSEELLRYPEDWRRASLGELSQKRPATVNPAKHPDQLFEYYSIPAYQQRQAPLLVAGSDIASSKLVFEPGTVLFGKLNPRVEKVWRVGNHSDHQKIGSTEWIPVVPTGEVNSIFLYFLFWSEHVLPIAKTLVSGSTPSRQRVDPTSFYRIEVPLPPLSEQRKIAAVLLLVQRAIEQQERLIELTAELKRALMHKLFTEGLHDEPKKQTEIGPVPESWDVVPLRDCAFVQTGIAKGRKVEPKEATTLPYLRVANVQDGRLDLSEIKRIIIREREKERYLLRHGDVVLTEGGDFDKLGRGFIWESQIEDCVHQNHIFAVRVDRERLLPEFFAYQSQSPYGKRYFLSVAHKTTNLASINTTKLKAFPVLLPRLEEQQRIASHLHTIDRKMQLHQARNDALHSLFRTLLHQLMTAQIRVDDLVLSMSDEELRSVDEHA